MGVVALKLTEHNSTHLPELLLRPPKHPKVHSLKLASGRVESFEAFSVPVIQ